MKRLIGGQPLYTKDKSVFSNASVICVGNRGKSITYQIRSEHGNIGILKDNEIEQWFNLHRLGENIVRPCVIVTAGSYSLSVSEVHGENIKRIVPAELYSVERKEVNVCELNINGKNWERFSELLCLGADI